MSSVTAVDAISGREPTWDDEIESCGSSVWPQFPLFGARVARVTRSGLAFGTIAGVRRTVASQEIVHGLKYDDGDVQHLSERSAAAAVTRASSDEAEEANK